MDFAFGSLLTDAESVPWIPLGPGEAFKPLRFLASNRGRVLLLRLNVALLLDPWVIGPVGGVGASRGRAWRGR